MLGTFRSSPKEFTRAVCCALVTRLRAEFTAKTVWLAGIAIFSVAILGGCSGRAAKPIAGQREGYLRAATAIEYPDLDANPSSQAQDTPRPLTINADQPPEFQDITLEETIHLALANSKVLRDLGGFVLRTPGAQRSTYDPAIQETDPRYGVQGALSAFDATFTSSLYHQQNNRALNNVFFGGGTRILKQNADTFQAQLDKRTVYGGEFALRQHTYFDSNNAPGNAFASAFTVDIEAEARQSLLRGMGADFGRIGGTSKTPGVYTGVLIARVNTDISIADFEASVRDFIGDVENAYWDLYFAYRDLDAKISARNSVSRPKSVAALAVQSNSSRRMALSMVGPMHSVVPNGC